jgi:hypothetical protein
LKLDAAQGDLRDAVGSVRNLAQLLSNVRVGPRAVEAVLPDVLAASRSIEGTVTTLLDLIAPHLEDRRAADELLEWTRPRAKELSEELARAAGKPVHAKQRLRLEQVLQRLSRELEATRALIELLDAAVRGSWVRIELAELIREATSADATAGVDVRLSSTLEGEVLLNPRVALALVAIGARLVSEQASAIPTVRARSTGSGSSLSLAVADGNEGGTSLVNLAAPSLIEPSLACALAAARASGMQVEYESDRHSFTLTWTA